MKLRWKDNSKEYHRIYMRKWKKKNRSRWLEISRGVNRRKLAKIRALPQAERTAYRARYSRRRRLWRRVNLRARLSDGLRARIRYALNGCKKAGKTLNLLGCTIDQLRAHLETQFRPGMTWDNYGQWHIDHKRPCAKFDLSKPEEQRACFHYTNLQPLWALENFKKGGR